MTRLEKFDKSKTARSLTEIWELLNEDERQYLCENIRVERFKKK